MPLVPCPTCGCHVRAEPGACVHCGATLPSSRLPTTTARVLGLALLLAGCPTPQPKYGVTVTDSYEETGDTPTTDTGPTTP